MFGNYGAGVGPSGRGAASAGEQAGAALGFLIFPTLTFVLLLWAGPDSGLAELLVYALPAAFTVATVWLCRLVEARVAWTIQVALACFFFCLGAGLAAGLLGFIGKF